FGISVFVIVHVTSAPAPTVIVAEAEPAAPVWPLVHVQAPTLYPGCEVSAIVCAPAATDTGVPVDVRAPSIVSGKSPGPSRPGPVVSPRLFTDLTSVSVPGASESVNVQTVSRPDWIARLLIPVAVCVPVGVPSAELFRTHWCAP